MDKVPGRVAQIFVWKQGTAPDIEYARQVLSVASPEAYAVLDGGTPLLQLFSVMGEWSEDPWERALRDMRAIPAPDNTRWTDSSRYLLKGWQGTDSRTGDKIFVVVAYYRSVSVPETFRGAAIEAPAYASTPPTQPQPQPQPQPSPYYQPYATGPLVWPQGQPQPQPQPQAQPQAQYPTGPLVWPQAQQPIQPPAGYGYPQYQGVPQGAPYWQPHPATGTLAQAQVGYPYGYNPMVTSQLGPSNLPMAAPPAEAVLPDSYAPFYAGFFTRLTAMVIDLFFMLWFYGALVAASFLVLGLIEWPGDVLTWLREYAWGYLVLFVLVFVLYHLIGWSTSGRTWGKKLIGIRVVRADGRPPGFSRALSRMLGYVISLGTLGWGFIMIALDSRRQGLHDKIAETFVLPDRPGAFVPAGLPGYPQGATPPHSAPAIPAPTPVAYPPFHAAPSHAGPAAPAGAQPYEAPSTPAPAPAPAAPAVEPPTTAPAPAEAGEPEAPPVAAPAPAATAPTMPAASAVPATPAQEAGANGRAAPVPPTEEAAQEAEPQPESAGPMPAQEEAAPQAETAEAEAVPSVVTGRLSPSLIGRPADSTRLPAQGQGQGQPARERPEHLSDADKARSLFRSGIETLERGVRRGYTGMEVEPGAAGTAANYFGEALQLVPGSAAYRYFYAVALRYAEGFETAISEFRQVLELDPGHFEARQQVAFGPRWHDAYAYPPWGERVVDVDMPLPEPVRALLPQPHRPGTRLVLLREGSNKMVVALSRTRRDTWSELPTADMPARIELVLTRTPSGPIIAFYVVIRDDPDNPYKGETFLNPHDPGQPSDDACQLGQHMLAQLARQDHTHLIFVDENDNLLLSRKLVFDTATQVNIARIHYEAQSLPSQVMDVTRFQQAAQWHMEHFSLDQIKA